MRSAPPPSAERHEDPMRSEAPIRYADASTRRVTADNAIEYAYRDLGDGDVPLVLLQHFRGNLDNWDPALVDALAADRRVVTFDNVGVGATTGRTPTPSRRWPTTPSPSSRRWTFERVDLLGFSIGSFVAQEIALIRPDLLRRVVLASSAPQGAAGMHGWAPEVIGAVGTPETSPQGYSRRLLRPDGHESRSRPAGRRAHLREGQPTETSRRRGRPARRSTTPSARGASPTTRCSQRVAAIDLPVFVANGDSDPMILPRYSYLLAGLLPDARVTIYPDSAHGFLFQHHSQFAADVHAFLEEAD